MGMRGLVVAGTVTCLALRFPSLLWPLGPDESGYVLVARAWKAAADSLYGFYFVDRPPLLLGLYAAAEDLGAPYLPRLVAALAACATVAIAARVGEILGGTKAAAWCTVAAVALTCNPMLGSYQAKAEILSLPLVMAACWLVLEASRGVSPGAQLLLAGLSGVAGTLALGLKQSLYGGLVFTALYILAGLLTRRLAPGLATRVSAGFLGGVGSTVILLLLWTQAQGVHLGTLWQALYAFRAEAWNAIVSHSMAAVGGRVTLLVAYFVLAGIGVVLAGLALRGREAWSSRPHVTLAVAGMVAADLVPVALGGAYWSSYLVPVVAGTLLALPLLPSPTMRLSGGICATSAAISLIVFTVVVLSGSVTPTRRYVGEAIGAASQGGDSLVVIYGHPDLVHASGLDSPYPYLWSLPTRVRDPELETLRALLAGPSRPTWVAVVLPPNSWKLDERRRLRALLDDGYREVGKPCGVRVLLRVDVRRELRPVDCERPAHRARGPLP